MEPQQASFDTFGRWMLARLRADLAPSCESPVPALYRFFAGLYDDMLEHPGAYGIPNEPFVTFIDRTTLTPEESAQHEALKAARMRVRKVVFAYLEFLFALGKAGTAVGEELAVSRENFEKQVADAGKKARLPAKGPTVLAALERLGCAFTSGDPVMVANHQYAGMPAALAAFSQACARVKDFDFYLFRRCDLAVFAGKTGPDFPDALRLCPAPFQKEVAETDERLRQLRLKREIFVDGGDMTYRIRYGKKGDALVYWCRIQETFQPDLRHYLRWKLDSDLTPRLFARLDASLPGLADQVFAGLKPCQHCYENCMDRSMVERGGVVKAACKGEGWNQIGYDREDYEKLWAVMAVMNALV